jgi:uncharacterized membrane protein YhaH (DUF805 family)
MSFAVERSGQVNQGTYWAFFGGMVILIPALLFGGVAAMLHGSFGTGLLMMAAILPVGIYWRVVMMRRCRDIGWPAFLPWLSFGLQFVASYSAMHSLQGIRYGVPPSASMLSMPLVMAFADFAFSIAIGCIGSKAAVDYAAVFGDAPGSYDRRPSSQPSRSPGSPPLVQPSRGGPEGGDRFDEAIARALEAHRRGESIMGSPPAPRPAPSDPPRRPAAFGKRVV